MFFFLYPKFSFEETIWVAALKYMFCSFSLWAHYYYYYFGTLKVEFDQGICLVYVGFCGGSATIYWIWLI